MLDIVFPDHSRLALVHDLTIGRAAGNTVRLRDPAVSRVHARIRAAPDGPVLEDAGSSYGTWLDGRRVRGPTPLHEGARIRLGNQQIVVDRPRGDAEAGPTVVVGDAPALAGRPRLRGGTSLKRLEAGEGPRRWVLQNHRSGRLVRLTDEDAALVGLLDGTRTVPDLVRTAQQRDGPVGAGRLTLLLASLEERGLLAGDGDADPPAATGRRLVVHQVAWPGAAEAFERLRRMGGGALVTRPAVAALAVLAVAGLAVFAYLVAGRYGTPFVVARKVGVGGLVFILGRLAVAAIHETAHGVVMAAFGRRVREAGLKLVLIFPYVYVDTSDAWFEPRRRRIAVSAAGPMSDLCVGASFALGCLVCAPGTLRDVLFQLALGAYVGAFFNLNPLLERDGYQILVDVLREPGLRRRARAQLRRRIVEGRSPADSTVLRRYAAIGLAWSAVGAVAGGAMALRYEQRFAALVPAPVVWTATAVVCATLFVPVLATVGPAVVARARRRRG